MSGQAAWLTPKDEFVEEFNQEKGQGGHEEEERRNKEMEVAGQEGERRRATRTGGISLK